MTIKETLAKISTYQNLPLCEFEQKREVLELSDNYDLIRKLEPYKVPEITKLICAKDELRALFAPKYDIVSPFFNQFSIEMILAWLWKYENTVEYNLEEIVPFLSEDMLHGFTCAFNRLYAELRGKRNSLSTKNEEADKLRKDISEKETEKEKLEAEETELSEDDDHDEMAAEIKKKIKTAKAFITKKTNRLIFVNEVIESETARIDEINALLQRTHAVRDAAEEAEQKAAARIASNRKNMYSILDEKQMVVEYLKEWNDTGKIHDDFVKMLRSNSSCYDVVAVLESTQDEQAISLIFTLFSNGFIDIFMEPFKTYLVERLDIVGDQLVRNLRNLQDDDDLDIWLDFVFEQAFDLPLNDFSRSSLEWLWNCIGTPELWEIVLKKLTEKYPDDMENIIAKMVLNSTGRPRKALLSETDKLVEEGIINSFSLLINALLQNQTPGDDCAIIVDFLVKRIESQLHAAKKQSERKQMMLERTPAIVFAAVSEPTEALEMLVSDLGVAGDTVSPEVIASQLKRNIVALREGFECVGVYPLEKPEDWVSQAKMPFAPTRHSIAVSSPPTSVYLRSMGFKYVDDEGEEITKVATVGRARDLKGTQAKTKTVKKRNVVAKKQSNTHSKKAVSAESKKGGKRK